MAGSLLDHHENFYGAVEAPQNECEVDGYESELGVAGCKQPSLVRVAVGLVGSVLSAGLEERLKDRLRFLEVVVHDIHEIVGVHDPIDELACRRFGIVELGPLTAEFVRFVLYVQLRESSSLKWKLAELTFQAMKLIASTMVGWTISLPGKTPQVTALGPSE